MSDKGEGDTNFDCEVFEGFIDDETLPPLLPITRQPHAVSPTEKLQQLEQGPPRPVHKIQHSEATMSTYPDTYRPDTYRPARQEPVDEPTSKAYKKPTSAQDLGYPRKSPRIRVQPTKTFHYFMKLPGELREFVYEQVLVSDKPIIPRICECLHHLNDVVKFYDCNGYIDDGTYGYGHGRVRRALNNILVSKQFYKEALKIFYSRNTFSYGADVPTYFERLSYLGRFHMLHHVTLPVQFLVENVGEKIIQTLARNLEDQTAFEESYKEKKSDACHGSLPLPMVKAHPMFHAAGLEFLGPFFMLQKLFVAYTGSDFERELVILCQAPQRFQEFNLTTWFIKVAESLGIKLKFFPADVSTNLPNLRNVVHIEWKLKYQKANLESRELQVQDKLTVANKGYDAFADTIQYELPNATAYLRTSCRGKREWYRVRCTENTSHSAEAANLDKQRQQALRVWEQWFKNGGFPPPQCPPQAPSQAQVRPKERPQQLLNHAQEDLARSLAEADDWSPNSSTLSSNSSTFDPPVPDTSETTRASTSTSSSRSLRQPGSRFRASSYYSQSLSQHETTASEPMRPVPAFSYQMSSLAGPTTSNSPYTAYSSPYRPQPETSTIASRLPSYTSQLQGYQQRHAQRQSAQSSNGNALDLATPTLSFRNSSAQSQAIPTLQSTNGNTHNQATPTLQSWNGNAQSQATPTLQSSNGNAQHQAAPAFRFLPRRTGRLSEQEREQMRERVIQLQIDRRHRRQAQAQAQAQARARAQGIVHPNLNWQLQGPSQVQGQDQGQGQGNGPPNQGLDYGDGN